MPHFDSMIQQKILLKRKLLQNQAVVNLLCNVGNNVAEFEDFKTGSKSPAEPLIKTHFYVPGTQTDDKKKKKIQKKTHTKKKKINQKQIKNPSKLFGF